jgi:TonB family protein
MKIIVLLCLTFLGSSVLSQVHCDSIDQDFSGMCVSTYSDGVIKSTTNYLNGVKNGEYKEFYHHGEPGAEGNYSEGNLVGVFERFSPYGEVILRTDIDETGNGELTKFNYNGSAIMTTGTFKNWKAAGVWKRFNYKGDLLEEREFDSSMSVGVDSVLTIEFGFGQEPEGVVNFPTFETDFIGGPSAMQKFISSEVKYPIKAVKKGITGKVYVSFVVNEDGSISDAKVVRGVHKLLDNEALRIVNAMPPWQPAVEGGMRVKARARLPITFSLNR